jgi:hypothetical protein
MELDWSLTSKCLWRPLGFFVTRKATTRVVIGRCNNKLGD